MWFIIKVEAPADIGKNEQRRVHVHGVYRWWERWETSIYHLAEKESKFTQRRRRMTYDYVTFYYKFNWFFGNINNIIINRIALYIMAIYSNITYCMYFNND